MNNAQRVFINTGALYIKIFVNTILVLFSTRYVLAALGAVDYGIYVVVGGVMGFMGFLTSAMATSSQRHLTYELGRGDHLQLVRIFNGCFFLHLLLALLIIVLGETLGLWFLDNILNIPEARQTAAFWVFQFTVVASVCYVISVPYQALLTAHEALALVALFGIIQSVLIFSVALWLGGYDGPRLESYALLSCVIAILMTLSQVFVSRRRYPESRICHKEWMNRRILSELASFSGWSLFGSLAVVTRSQGVAFLLNIYFGPLANAALGIANQVYGAISQFTQAILQVLSPRLVKHEGSGNREHMLELAVLICKYSFFIGCFWGIPLFVELPAVLNFWLKNPPEHTVVFCRVIVLLYLCDQLSAGLTIPVHAIGMIARVQVIGGLIHISTIPLAFLIIFLGGNESLVLLASLLTTTFNMALRGYLLKGITDFSYCVWLKNVVLRGGAAILPTIIVIGVLTIFVAPSWARLLSVIVISSVLNIFSFLFVGITAAERTHLTTILCSLRKKAPTYS